MGGGARCYDIYGDFRVRCFRLVLFLGKDVGEIYGG